MNASESLKNAFIGLLMGIFMMMPGASGATISVVFGIYERLIRDISKLTRYLREDFWFLLTVGIGGVAGVLLCAKGLDFLIGEYEIPLMFFFGALILVQIPDIWKQGDDRERLTAYNILGIIVGFAIMMVVLYFGLNMPEQTESPGPVLMFLTGMLYAVCAVSPGISGSTLLLALGLFTGLVDSLSDIHLSTFLPLVLGAVVGVLLFAKIVDRCLTDHKKSTFCVIVGLTAGSVVTVITEAALKMDGDDGTLGCVLGIILGLAAGYCIHMLTAKLSDAGKQ